MRILCITLDYQLGTFWQRITNHTPIDISRFLKYSFGQRVCEYYFFTRTLVQMSHIVCDCPYTHMERRTHPQTYFPRMKKVFEHFRPDLVFYNPQGDELISNLEWIKKRCPVVAWGSDDDSRWEDLGKHIAPMVNLYVTTYLSSKAKGEVEGMSNIIRSQWACVPDLHVPARSKDVPVAFVGSIYGNRREIIDRFIQERIPITVRSTVSWHEYFNLLGKAKIQITPSLNFNQKMKQIKARHFEVPAFGSVQVTDGDPAMLGEYFKEDEIIYAETPETIVIAVRKLLNDPERLTCIANAGRKRVLENHTYQHRLKEILSHPALKI